MGERDRKFFGCVSVSVRHYDNDLSLVRLKGRLTMERYRGLSKYVVERLEERDSAVVLDLRKVRRFDDTGVSGLLYIRRKIPQRKIFLLGAGEFVKNRFEIDGCDWAFEYVDEVPNENKDRNR